MKRLTARPTRRRRPPDRRVTEELSVIVDVRTDALAHLPGPTPRR